jgi:carbon monoxide dehydrogenase subunit G
MALKHYSTGRVKVNRPVSDFYTFISDFNNFKALLPSQVSTYRSDADSCAFTISGLPELKLRISERVEDEMLKISPDGESPLPFELKCLMQANDENTSFVEVQLEAEISPLLAMMISKHLETFIEMMREKLVNF